MHTQRDFKQINIRMNTKELKLELIQTIVATQSDSLLAEIRKLVRMDSEHEAIYELNDQQIRQIQIAEQQIVDGKYLTHEAAQKQTEEWLRD